MKAATASAPGAAARARPAPAQGTEAAAAGVLRFITCGSVDDGKSTLIGRLLWDTRQVFEDHAAGLARDSLRHGTRGGAPDFALLLDGLAAEREQGITIDVAYRFFTAAGRRFVVADCPGHEQYTRNMVTGASGADAAVLLVDAQKGVLEQTCRHARLCALMGVRQMVLAVNKMDSVGFGQEAFTAIAASFAQFAAPLGLDCLIAIPIAALDGDNVAVRSRRMPWYAGPTLLEALVAFTPHAAATGSFAFPVQWVNRPDASFRGYAGTVTGGGVRRGDAVRVSHSGRSAAIERIVTMDGDLSHAPAGAAVTLVLDRELDVSRGDVLSPADRPIDLTDQFEASVIWMDASPGLIGRTYDLKLATQWAGASISAIKYRVDVGSTLQQACASLAMNDIAVCNLALSREVAFDAFERSRTLGGFILVDRLSRATVAAGLIRHSLRRAQNVHRQAVNVVAADRHRQNGHPGHVIWFTGLSGAGKSTLANALETALHARGVRTYLLDGDNVRQGLNRDLGFTDADRVENIRRVAEVARLMLDAGLVVLVSFISPFERERAMARELIGEAHFLQVYVSTPLAACEARDPKGLYRKARAGVLPNLSGIGSAYEAPDSADLAVDTSAVSVAAAVEAMLAALQPSIGGGRVDLSPPEPCA